MSFNICVVKNPILVFDERRQCEVMLLNERAGDRVLDFNFEYDDFEALQNFLYINLSPVEQREDEDCANFSRRRENNFLESAKGKGFPMLGRFWDWYNCATYFSSEISTLKMECLKIKNGAPSEHLLKAVNKILAGATKPQNQTAGLNLPVIKNGKSKFSQKIRFDKRTLATESNRRTKRSGS
jgi:hypothetical protein